MPAKNFFAYFIFCGALTACFSAKAEIPESGVEGTESWIFYTDKGSIDFIRISGYSTEKNKLVSLFFVETKSSRLIGYSFATENLIYKSIDHVKPLYILFGQLIL